MQEGGSFLCRGRRAGTLSSRACPQRPWRELLEKQGVGREEAYDLLEAM